MFININLNCKKKIEKFEAQMKSDSNDLNNGLWYHFVT